MTMSLPVTSHTFCPYTILLMFSAFTNLCVFETYRTVAYLKYVGIYFMFSSAMP
jgi:hypothetical protein